MEGLTPEQKKCVVQWVKDGSNLSDVQKRLRTEFNLSLTYMDVRLLVIELGLTVKEKAQPAAPAKGVDKRSSPPKDGAPQRDDWDQDEPPGPDSTVSVTVDRIVKPGTLVSGNVTFSDGVSMGWGLDQFGRLALSGGKPGYKPSQQDVAAFQMQLRRLLEQKGFGG
jgi:hypothetical protein